MYDVRKENSQKILTAYRRRSTAARGTDALHRRHVEPTHCTASLNTMGEIERLRTRWAEALEAHPLLAGVPRA